MSASKCEACGNQDNVVDGGINLCRACISLWFRARRVNEVVMGRENPQLEALGKVVIMLEKDALDKEKDNPKDSLLEKILVIFEKYAKDKKEADSKGAKI